MTRAVRINPCSPASGRIRPPGSKSITNRALVCAALASGTSRLRGALDSEDTQVMLTAWRGLGIEIQDSLAGTELTVQGCGGRLPPQAEGLTQIFVGNSGTTIRFLSAALAAAGGNYRLDGVERMRERPIADLLDALRQLGCDVSSDNPELPDCPPVIIRSGGMRGGTAIVSGSISSQYLSGLMMAAPLAAAPVTLQVEGELVSTPYVEMTSAVMRSFGADIHGQACGPLHIDPRRKYIATDYSIEPDASAASYFWGAAAITGGTARVDGLSRQSLQGDVAFCDVLQQMGCQVDYGEDYIEVRSQTRDGQPLRGVDVDMGHISDTVQTLAAVALFAEGETVVRGVAHNRVKETDRIADLARELRRLGAEVTELPDGMRIRPPIAVQSAELETYKDHRMAMSLALVGLRAEGIVIKDPACTAKTYPHYWEDLQLFNGCRIERLN